MMEYLDIIIAFITGGGLLSIGTFKFTRTQAKADAMKAVQDVYQETIQDLRTDKELMKADNNEMREEINSLRKTVDSNTRDIRALKRDRCTVRDCKNRMRE